MLRNADAPALQKIAAVHFSFFCPVPDFGYPIQHQCLFRGQAPISLRTIKRLLAMVLWTFSLI
jgi:hypothetical protein